MLKKTALAKAISFTAIGTMITAASITSASASGTTYNTYHAYSSNIATNAGTTDGWTAPAGWTSATAPFGSTAIVANWAAEISTAGDSLSISSQDAYNRYGIWADIDTAKGAWFDGTKGWGHNTDVGLFKSMVDANITINATSIQPSTSPETWTNFGISVYTGMASASDGWHHHGQWNCPSCTVTVDGSAIQFFPTFEDDNPLSSGGLSYLTHSANVDSLNSITFQANAGQVYSILLGGNDGGSNFGPHAGYSLNIATSPVPLPAAVWLFAGAVAGLTGMQRKKSKA